MQVAVYARVSSRRQTQAQTIEQQLERLRAHAAAQGWALAPEHVFRDDGHSGASLGRPGRHRQVVVPGPTELVGRGRCRRGVQAATVAPLISAHVLNARALAARYCSAGT
jgi:hypothetical protein